MGRLKDERRKGDSRAFRHDPLVKIRWWPMKGYPFRWNPNQGEPECVGERFSQWTWDHRVLLYIAVVVTLILAVELFGISFVGETHA